MFSTLLFTVSFAFSSHILSICFLLFRNSSRSKAYCSRECDVDVVADVPADDDNNDDDELSDTFQFAFKPSSVWFRLF